MHMIYVLPAGEDIAAFRNGDKPNNCLISEFETLEELTSYQEGLEAVYDLVEYEIVSQGPFDVSVRFDDDDSVSNYTFKSIAEKNAYIKGLEDGDGFKAPLAITEDDDEDFKAISAMLPQTAAATRVKQARPG